MKFLFVWELASPISITNYSYFCFNSYFIPGCFFLVISFHRQTLEEDEIREKNQVKYYMETKYKGTHYAIDYLLWEENHLLSIIFPPPLLSPSSVFPLKILDSIYWKIQYPHVQYSFLIFEILISIPIWK